MSLERKLARSFVKSLNQMERNRVRTANQRERERVKQLKQMERNLAKAEKERAKWEKQQYIESRKVKVSLQNQILEANLHALESILKATLDVDDYFDLNNLKKTDLSHPFENKSLQMPLPVPEKSDLPPKPEFVEPKLPFTIFGRKQKKAALLESEQRKHDRTVKKWEKKVQRAEAKHKSAIASHKNAEKQRKVDLEAALESHQRELESHNAQIDQFINFLAYGDKSAVEDYISIIMDNSLYPEGFNVSTEVEFDPNLAELCLQVKIPAPSEFESIKTYRYIQSRDEITHSEISKAERKRRYASVLNQVALRTAHEVFEADRGGIIKSVAITLGTEATDPATGVDRFITLAGLSCRRDEFEKIELSSIEPAATMKHLKAVISKNPVELIEIDTSGVRKSR